MLLYLLDHTEKHLTGAELQDLRQEFGPNLRMQTISCNSLLARYQNQRIDWTEVAGVLFPRGRLPIIPDALQLRRIRHYRFRYFPDVPSSRELMRIRGIPILEDTVRKAQPIFAS
jgi:hypothetical protein